MVIFVNNQLQTMERIFLKSQAKIDNVNLSFKRFLFDVDYSKHRIVAIKGARGTGKTTLLLQHAKRLTDDGVNALYVAMDDLFFQDKSLYELAEKFALNKGEYLFLDEVHKYPNWSRELKLIYDDIPGVNVVFTSSSILDIYNAESDLSRRVVSYILPELSLREYINMLSGMNLPSYSLSEIVENHKLIARELLKFIKPVYEFNNYLKHGQYPYFIEGVDVYYQKLLATINLILELDLQSIENLDYGNVVKLKMLLYSISTSVPYVPNISRLSEKIGLSRPFLIRALNLLEKSQLIKQVNKNSKEISYLSKPDKIYLKNTNILFAIGGDNTEKGTLRETFFANQTGNFHHITLPETGDFLVDNIYTFEVGGKNKQMKQIKDTKNGFIVKDDIEIGAMNIIPLWLFGFLY
ncbi:MAG: AAA family ATPase [Prolixibacteraceae bacterium]|nr:AAA family ATPase [Prolixibacteraceae bacterium]MBN2649068.1 AAA family ATPase [Prolixibacteraceae bacterium]